MFFNLFCLFLVFYLIIFKFIKYIFRTNTHIKCPMVDRSHDKDSKLALYVEVETQV